VLIDTIDIRSSALLLDVDGTLLDIADTPFGVDVPERLKEALAVVSSKTDGATAFVSGRPMADLDRLFAPLKLAAVAGHGAELRASGVAGIKRGEGPISTTLRQSLAAFAAAHPGVTLEDKGYSLAVHYRLAPQHAAAVKAAVADACAASHSPDVLDVLPGKAVVEVKAAAVNKGTGIRELMTHPPFRGRRPIFIGDDVTDQAAFAVLPAFAGLGFSVGFEMPGLAGFFQAPSDVRAWLYRLAENGAASVS
jgi:trehalose 6-phosphate phosphatase